MKLNALLTAAAVTVALASVAGCGQQSDERPMKSAPTYGQNRTTPATPPAGTMADRSTGATQGQTSGMGQKLDDARVTAKVKAALLADRNVDGSAIDVDTSQGHVTLKGEVADKTQIDRAIKTASAVEGVKDVDSMLTARGSS
jgi:hyperosmotically inducible protein